MLPTLGWAEDPAPVPDHAYIDFGDHWKMGCTRLREGRIVERHPNRENVIALYLKEHLGAAEVKILVDHPSRRLSTTSTRAQGVRRSGRSSSALQ